jgi:protein-tyrosine phosphatase
MNTVLFLCTGNYYRSRFAEYLFNHLASQQTLEWRADSRGLRPSHRNVGPISFHAVDGLNRLEITGFEERLPIQLSDSDLRTATHIVAVQKEEHLPMMQQLFPDWIARTEFWGVADIEFREPADALAELEQEVRKLVERLNY